MEGSELWRELGQQLRVDSAPRGGGPEVGPSDLVDVRGRPHVGAAREVPQVRLRQAGRPAERPLVFSKGHASPLLYSMYKAAGAITDEELLTFRKFGSRLEGHPVPVLPWVDVATGSLGQGLPYGVGIALAGKRLDRLPYRIWVLCGDSEMAEGSMWEAFEHACARKARQPDRDHRREPARPARRDDARLGSRLVREAGARPSAGMRSRSTATMSRRSTRAYAEALETSGTPTVIVARRSRARA